LEYKDFASEERSTAPIYRLLDDIPLHYSASKRKYLSVNGDAYHFSRHLKAETDARLIEPRKMGYAPYGNLKICMLGRPGFKTPNISYLREVRKRRSIMHQDLKIATKQVFKGFGSYPNGNESNLLVEGRTNSGKKYMLLCLPRIGPFLVIIKQQNCRPVDRCDIRKFLEGLREEVVRENAWVRAWLSDHRQGRSNKEAVISHRNYRGAAPRASKGVKGDLRKRVLRRGDERDVGEVCGWLVESEKSQGYFRSADHFDENARSDNNAAPIRPLPIVIAAPELGGSLTKRRDVAHIRVQKEVPPKSGNWVPIQYVPEHDGHALSADDFDRLGYFEPVTDQYEHYQIVETACRRFIIDQYKRRYGKRYGICMRLGVNPWGIYPKVDAIHPRWRELQEKILHWCNVIVDAHPERCVFFRGGRYAYRGDWYKYKPPPA